MLYNFPTHILSFTTPSIYVAPTVWLSAWLSHTSLNLTAQALYLYWWWLICHRISFPVNFSQITEILPQYVYAWYLLGHLAHPKIYCVGQQFACSHLFCSHLFCWIINTLPKPLPIVPQLILALSLSPAIWPIMSSQFNMGSAQSPLPMIILASLSSAGHVSCWVSPNNISCILMPTFLAFG